MYSVVVVMGEEIEWLSKFYCHNEWCGVVRKEDPDADISKWNLIYLNNPNKSAVEPEFRKKKQLWKNLTKQNLTMTVEKPDNMSDDGMDDDEDLALNMKKPGD